MKRRDIIKYLSVTPLAGMVNLTDPSGQPSAKPTKKPKRDIIKELGIRTFINAAGTYTFMTASLMDEDVMDTIEYTGEHFMIMSEVQDKAGAKIAALCHAESAMVTAGCWSALVLGTAAVLTGKDKLKIGKLPDLSGFEKTEVIVQKAHNESYTHALTNAGIIPVVVETADELEKAISSKTAMLFFLNYQAPNGQIKHEEFVAISKKHGIPCMIDIAADIPPVENLWKYNDMGFDLVCVSGGKAMRGPQSAGILMGKKDLIDAARLNAPPNGGNIGRGMKVNKEEVLGMYVALEKYIKKDHAAEWKSWEDRVQVIVKEVSKIKGVKTEVTVPPIANHVPTLKISWTDQIKATPQEVHKKLQDGTPSIEVMTSPTTVNLTVFMLKPGEDKLVAKRLKEVLSSFA